MGRIYLLRHGETTANRDQVIQGPRIDAELSERGHAQAQRAGSALAHAPIHTVYTSPMLRARQTAQAVVEKHATRRALPENGVPRSDRAPVSLQVVPELYEMDYGQFIGRGYDEVRSDMEQVLDAWRMGFVQEPFPGGESAVLAQHRIRPFATRVKESATRNDVAVVAHGRINRILLATWTGSGLTRLEEYPQSNACISEIVVDSDGATVARLNDTSHLEIATNSFA